MIDPFCPFISPTSISFCAFRLPSTFYAFSSPLCFVFSSPLYQCLCLFFSPLKFTSFILQPLSVSVIFATPQHFTPSLLPFVLSSLLPSISVCAFSSPLYNLRLLFSNLYQFLWFSQPLNILRLLFSPLFCLLFSPLSVFVPFLLPSTIYVFYSPTSISFCAFRLPSTFYAFSSPLCFVFSSPLYQCLCLFFSPLQFTSFILQPLSVSVIFATPQHFTPSLLPFVLSSLLPSISVCAFSSSPLHFTSSLLLFVFSFLTHLVPCFFLPSMFCHLSSPQSVSVLFLLPSTFYVFFSPLYFVFSSPLYQFLCFFFSPQHFTSSLLPFVLSSLLLSASLLFFLP